MNGITRILLVWSAVVMGGLTSHGQELPTIALHPQPNQLVIMADTAPIATYVYSDNRIARPYFAHVHAPGRIQVTRNHPPVPGKDAVDHDTFHPGIWLAYGDLGGNDYWRLKAKVEHDRFIEQVSEPGHARFRVKSKYLSQKDQKPICEEMLRTDIWLRSSGFLFVLEAEYSSLTSDLYFGDQEEMGLGIRVATPISVTKGGRMVDSEGRQNEKQIWGKSAAWCDYWGKINGTPAGILLVPDPANFRPSRFHARDYGFLAANPFAIKSFKAGEASRTKVNRFEFFRVRYAVLVHAGETPTADWLSAAAADAVGVMATP